MNFNIGDIGKLMGEAKKMSAQSEEIKEKLKEKRVTGTAGGDFVTVTANGAGDILNIEISNELFYMNDKKMIEDMVAGGVNDALAKSKECIKEFVPEGMEDIMNKFNLK